MLPSIVPASGTLPTDRIVRGDCVEVMKGLPTESIDLVVTDPPYLVNYNDRSGRSIMGDREGHWLEPAFAEVYRLMKPDSFCASFYGSHVVDSFMHAWKKAGLRPVGHIVFSKRYASGKSYTARHHEQAYLLAKGKPPLPAKPLPDVLPWRYTGNRLHPTQKPVMAIRPLIETFSRPGDIVLDPFCGSGTTPIAARLCGRRYLGIEKDAGYHRIAEQRLRSA